jgi:hypothetical protein
MRRRKAQSASPQPNRRWQRYRLHTLLVVVIGAALAIGIAKWQFRAARPTYRSLPEVLAQGNCGDFDLVQGPDRPGPYEDMGAVPARKGEPIFGSFSANGKTRKVHVPGVPGEEFRVVGLLPQSGGEPTYIVLKRHTK